MVEELMKLDSISTEIWQNVEKASPQFLCQLPFSVAETEKLIEVEFEESVEDGLGAVFYTLFSLKNQHVLLKGFQDRQIKQDFGVCAYMHSNEKDPRELLKNITIALGIDESCLRELGESLDSPKYLLSRLDDNNNEIDRFHDESVAQYLKKEFQERGHKQDYYVHEMA